MELKQRYNLFKDELSKNYDVQETKSFFYLIMNHLKGYSKTDLLLKENETLNKEEDQFLVDVVMRLLNNEPIQYIIGKTEFYGLPFIVNSNVLIPRPETEELVRWVIEYVGEQKKTIIDICAGSGCIGIALKSNLLQCDVELVELSNGAIEVAKENAARNKVEVRILEKDILQEELDAKVDVIVSNPPYVKLSEKELMNKNVLDHEPHLALFVEDNDSLLFYRRIGELGQKYLNEGGVLFFEINEALGCETKQLLEQLNYSNVFVKKDLNGKDRMVRAIR